MSLLSHNLITSYRSCLLILWLLGLEFQHTKLGEGTNIHIVTPMNPFSLPNLCYQPQAFIIPICHWLHRKPYKDSFYVVLHIEENNTFPLPAFLLSKTVICGVKGVNVFRKPFLIYWSLHLDQRYSIIIQQTHAWKANQGSLRLNSTSMVPHLRFQAHYIPLTVKQFNSSMTQKYPFSQLEVTTSIWVWGSVWQIHSPSSSHLGWSSWL